RSPRLDAEAGVVNTSQLGHALVLEMADHGLLEAETTTTRDGTLMVERVLHPLIFGLDFGRSLAACGHRDYNDQRAAPETGAARHPCGRLCVTSPDCDAASGAPRFPPGC